MSIISCISVDAFCLILLLFVYIKEMLRSNRFSDIPQYKHILIMAISFIVIDGMTMLVQYDFLPKAVTFSNILCILYYYTATAITLHWFFMVDRFLVLETDKKPANRLLLGIPVIIFAVLLVLSPFFGLVFRYDENVQFVRGPLNFLFFVLNHGFVLFSIFFLLNRKGAHNRTLFRKTRLNMILFPLPLLVASIAQIFLPQFSITPIGYVFSLLLFYSNYRTSISTGDHLTTLHNRNYIINYMEELLQKKAPFFCIMMDIDKFKSVNDVYGHITGDMVLMQFGATLRDTANDHHFQAARYAGDEFIVACRTENAEEVEAFCEDFRSSLKTVLIPNTEQSISASMGYAMSGVEFSTVDEIISLADERMYSNKKRGSR